ncbi:MAG: DNA polymerase Y family protein [Phycisphaerae bacterium]
MKRAMCLYFPNLAIDRLQVEIDGSALKGASNPKLRVVVAEQARVVRVVQVDALAVRAGIRAGMPLAEAKALAPELLARPHWPGADRAALESLAVWADRLSPYVHLHGPDALLADLTGTGRLFGDEQALLRRVSDAMSGLGYTARVALADTFGAAWALAHAHLADRIVAPPGRAAAYLAPLPVWALRIDPGQVTELARLGVETIEALLHLPRSSLAARFGDELLWRLDQALGDAPEVLEPFRPAQVLKRSLRIARPTDRWEVLDEALRRVLVSFCEQLERDVAGVRQVFVTFYCPQLRPVTLEVSVSRATRSVDHLHELLRARLEAEHLPAQADGLTIWARRTEPLDGWQDELFDTGQADAQALASLIDRLTSRLGAEAVVRAIPVSDHQPECAFTYVEASSSFE